MNQEARGTVFVLLALVLLLAVVALARQRRSATEPDRTGRQTGVAIPAAASTGATGAGRRRPPVTRPLSGNKRSVQFDPSPDESRVRPVPSPYGDGGAQRLLSTRQRVLLTALVLLVVAVAFRWPHELTAGVIGITTLTYLASGLFRTGLITTAWVRGPDRAPLPRTRLEDDLLPRYTVFVPLYREGNVLTPLVSHLTCLDYPADRLEILLLCEASDRDTVEAVEERRLAAPFRLVVCPDGKPRTKPRACNLGLDQATGDLCVIYDAEDRPALDQLRRAAETFHDLPTDVMCLQARLDYHNADHNWLTRLFSIEYSFWFHLLLPALIRRDMPIPLGGTSNHFRTLQLRTLGGWDAYNVTEDADLGLRLYGLGGRTAMLDSDTLEEACAEVGPWIRQRTRWLKGYLQTWAVHTRAGGHLRRRGGWRARATLHLLIGGTPLGNAANAIFWVLMIYFVITRANWVQALFPGPLLWLSVIALTLGNGLFIFGGFLAVARREHWHLGRSVLLMPFYWLLLSAASWRAILQLATRLHVWEKTPHGLSGGDTDPAMSPRLRHQYAPSTVSAGSDGPIS